jgi:hypothetical protein
MFLKITYTVHVLVFVFFLSSCNKSTKCEIEIFDDYLKLEWQKGKDNFEVWHKIDSTSNDTLYSYVKSTSFKLNNKELEHFIKDIGFKNFIGSKMELVNTVIFSNKIYSKDSRLEQEDILGLLLYYFKDGNLRTKVYKSNGNTLANIDELNFIPDIIATNSYYACGQILTDSAYSTIQIGNHEGKFPESKNGKIYCKFLEEYFHNMN